MMNNIDAPSKELQEALYRVESMRTDILEMLYENSYIRVNGEKKVKVKAGEKHYADPFRIVMINSHTVPNEQTTNSVMETVFRFPNSHTVCIDLLIHHEIEKLRKRGCRPYSHLTEHLTASFKYGQSDSSSTVLRNRSLMQIESFLVNISSPLEIF